MKKLLFVAAALVVVSLSSCKKDSVCKLDGQEVGTCEESKGCKGVVKTAWETSCKNAGGKVSKK
jgi:hypothetical protein